MQENVTNAPGGSENKNKLIIESEIIDTLPSIVKTELSKMSEMTQSQFVEEYLRKKKSVGTAYFFLLLCLGMPYGYLGKWGLQWVYWLSWFSMVGGFCWCIYLICTLPNMVKSYNSDVAMAVFRDIKVMS